MLLINSLIHSIVLLFGIISLASTTLAPKDRQKKGQKQNKDVVIKSGPQDANVIERQLIDAEPSGRDILVENAAYYQNTKNRLFNGTVLGFVTPVCVLGVIYVHNNSIMITHIYLFLSVEQPWI